MMISSIRAPFSGAAASCARKAGTQQHKKMTVKRNFRTVKGNHFIRNRTRAMIGLLGQNSPDHLEFPVLLIYPVQRVGCQHLHSQCNQSRPIQPQRQGQSIVSFSWSFNVIITFLHFTKNNRIHKKMTLISLPDDKEINLRFLKS